MSVTLAVLAGLAGCGPTTGERATLGLAWSECRIRGHVRSGLCATVEVPEDRARPDGRRIGLRVVRFPAGDGTPEPDPLLMLAGGPGQAGTEVLGPIVRALLKLRATRDVLVVDARGTGQSGPIPCGAEATDPVAALAGPAAVRDADLARLRACRDAFDGDLGAYGTTAIVADLEDVRAALGVERWNLWGGSYGTRIAQEYARAHPERVRSLVLDGVVPPSARPVADAAAGADRAVEATLGACEAEPACAAAAPAIASRWKDLRARLDAAPLTSVIAHPRTDAPVEVFVDGETAIRLARLYTYVPESAAWLPGVVDALDGGDAAPLLAGLMPLVGELAHATNPLQQLAVTCPEDGQRLGPDDRAVPGVARAVALCDGWPAAAVDPARLEPLRSDVPALLLSGGLDPVTPPGYAAEVARTLPNAIQVIAAGSGHGVSTQGCAADLVARFVEDLGGASFPAGCLDHLEAAPRPAFPVGATELSP